MTKVGSIISDCYEGSVVKGLKAMQKMKSFNENNIRVYSLKQVELKFDSVVNETHDVFEHLSKD